jgi:hypothetical protein
MASASCWSLLDHLEHNGQSGRSRGMTAVFVSLSSLKDEPPGCAPRRSLDALVDWL